MNIIFVMYKFSYLFKLQTSDNNIDSDEYNRLFLLNAHHLQYMSSSVVLENESEHSLHYFHLDRISDLFLFIARVPTCC